MAAGQWTTSEALAWRTFITMSHHLERHLGRHLQRDFGMSGADFEILAHVSEAPGGQMAVAELAEAIHWEKSRLSHQLRRMSDRDLVCRSTSNRRRHTVSLTEAGWTAIRAAAPANAEHVRAFFVDALGPEQLDTMRHLSTAILNAIDAHVATSCTARG